MVPAAATPHLPHRAPIDGYGKGGFSFAGMSHRGSLLCLPSGIWAWPVAQPSDIDEAALAPVFAEASDIGLFLLGAGRDAWIMPDPLRLVFVTRRFPSRWPAPGRRSAPTISCSAKAAAWPRA